MTLSIVRHCCQTETDHPCVFSLHFTGICRVPIQSWPLRSCHKMVQLDHRLLSDARRFITGANVHRVTEMILAYEQAVYLHNCAWGSHCKYESQHETRLRSY